MSASTVFSLSPQRLSVPNPYHKAGIVADEGTELSEDKSKLIINGRAVAISAIEQAIDYAFYSVLDTHYDQLGDMLAVSTDKRINIADLGLYGETHIGVNESGATIVQLTLLLTIPNCPTKPEMKLALLAAAKTQLSTVPGLGNEVIITVKDQYELYAGALFAAEEEQAQLASILAGLDPAGKSAIEYKAAVNSSVGQIQSRFLQYYDPIDWQVFVNINAAWIPPNTYDKFQPYVQQRAARSDVILEEEFGNLMDFLTKASQVSRNLWSDPAIEVIMRIEDEDMRRREIFQLVKVHEEKFGACAVEITA